MPTHIALGRSVGLDDERLAAVTGESASDDLFSPLEQAVIEYARRLTRSEPIDDALYGALAEELTLAQLMELCFTVGIANMVNRFHATFHTPLDERTRAHLAEGSPLPLPPPPEPSPG